MESHVLMPEALSLSVQRPTNSMSVARMLEQTVTVVAAQSVPKGTRFAPTSGTVRIGRLDVYSTLQDSDVSQKYKRTNLIIEDISSLPLVYRKSNLAGT